MNAVTNEFNIQSEDFPALPGAPPGGQARPTTPNSAQLQALHASFGAPGSDAVVVNTLASLTQQMAVGNPSSGSSSQGMNSVDMDGVLVVFAVYMVA